MFTLLQELKRCAQQQAKQRLEEQLVELNSTIDDIVHKIANLEFESVNHLPN